MNDEKVDNPARGLNGRTAFVVAVLSAVFGSISGPVLLVKFGGDSVLAPDRFTGSQASAVIDPLKTRIEHLESEVIQHRNNHPDQIGDFRARISALEAQNELIIAQLNRVLDRLDRRD